MIQPCIWFKEEPSQFSMGQTAPSLTCSIMEQPHTGLDECPRILLSCFRARNSETGLELADTQVAQGQTGRERSDSSAAFIRWPFSARSLAYPFLYQVNVTFLVSCVTTHTHSTHGLAARNPTRRFSRITCSAMVQALTDTQPIEIA